MPVGWVKVPCTYETPRWRTLNSTPECTGSIFRVVVCAEAAAASSAVARTRAEERNDFTIFKIHLLPVSEWFCDYRYFDVETCKLDSGKIPHSKSPTVVPKLHTVTTSAHGEQMFWGCKLGQETKGG